MNDLVIAGIVTNAVLAVAAFWYAYETQQMKRALQDQIQMGVTPAILCSLGTASEEDARIWAANRAINSEAEEIEGTLQCNVSVVNDRVARFVSLFVYDQVEDEYWTSHLRSYEVIEPGGGSSFLVNDGPTTREGIQRYVEQRYPDRAELVQDALEKDDRSLALVVFEDLYGNLHGRIRRFAARDSGRIDHYEGESLILEPEDRWPVLSELREASGALGRLGGIHP